MVKTFFNVTSFFFFYFIIVNTRLVFCVGYGGNKKSEFTIVTQYLKRHGLSRVYLNFVFSLTTCLYSCLKCILNS